jgi:hypothetical protein
VVVNMHGRTTISTEKEIVHMKFWRERGVLVDKVKTA